MTAPSKFPLRFLDLPKERCLLMSDQLAEPRVLDPRSQDAVSNFGV